MTASDSNSDSRILDLDSPAPVDTGDEGSNNGAERFAVLDLDGSGAKSEAAEAAPEVHTARDGEYFKGGFMREGDKVSHHLGGRKFTKAAEARAAFGLDWKVRLEPVFFDVVRPVEVPATNVVVRNDNNAVLGVVGGRYEVLQNDILDVIDAITDKAPIVRGGEFAGGKRTWLQTELCRINTPSGEAVGHGLAHTSHDGTQPLTFSLTGKVVVCQNTCNAALATAKNQWRIRHFASAVDRINAIRDAYASAPKYYKDLQEIFMAMGRKSVKTTDLQDMLKTMFPCKDEAKVSPRTEAARYAFLDAYCNAPGAMPGTAWGLYQASTNYIDHKRNLRASDAEENSWLGAGAEIREKAFQYVTRLL